MENERYNQLVESADEYLRRNRIIEMFEDLSTSACFKQPENLKEFIVDELKQRQKHGFIAGVFSPVEVKNTFELFDLKKDGYISRDKCRQALLTMASSEHHEKVIKETEVIEDKVDYSRFCRICEMLLGIR